MLIDQDAPFRLAWQTLDAPSRLYEGDAIGFMASLPDASVDCIWTDPPYLLSNGGVTCVAGKRVSVDKGEWDQSQGMELDHQFNLSWLGQCYRVLKPSGTIWVTGTLHVYLSVGYGNDAVRFPHSERHHLGEAQPAAQFGLPVFHPCHRDDSLGDQGLKA